MPAPVTPMSEQQAAARRHNVRRTALVVAVLAIVIYVGFILSGVVVR
ncbi:MAG TPA: hypothetical protein VHF02_09995 [Luteimonas sp.]|nr:hypothetical protein [Luteimonas sp.]